MNPNPNSKTVPILTRPAPSNFTNAMLSRKTEKMRVIMFHLKWDHQSKTETTLPIRWVQKAPFARSMGIKK